MHHELHITYKEDHLHMHVSHTEEHHHHTSECTNPGTSMPKVGPDAFKDWAGTVGQFGPGETNDRGLRLLEFAFSQRLTNANTLYPHKLSRRTTWHAPNGKTLN
jgi:hypothetical protein